MDCGFHTPDVTVTYDRAGRLATVTDGTGTHGFAWNAAGQVTAAGYTAGPLAGIAVTYGYDALLRRQRTTLVRDAQTVGETTYAYEPQTGRLATVTDGAMVATYDYLAESGVVAGVRLANGPTTVLRNARLFDNLQRLTRTAWTADPAPGARGSALAPGTSPPRDRQAPAWPWAAASDGTVGVNYVDFTPIRNELLEKLEDAVLPVE